MLRKNKCENCLLCENREIRGKCGGRMGEGDRGTCGLSVLQKKTKKTPLYWCHSKNTNPIQIDGLYNWIQECAAHESRRTLTGCCSALFLRLVAEGFTRWHSSWGKSIACLKISEARHSVTSHQAAGSTLSW